MDHKKALNEAQYKEFKLSSFSVNNVITVYVLAVIIFLSGLMAYISMPSETFPEIVLPQIYVGTPYPGNSPMDIEKLITRPLEKEINGISGIDEITSTSVEGYSTIQIVFNFSVPVEEALRKVKDKVDIAKGKADFPQDLPADPNVFEMNLSEMMPIQNINLSGNFNLDQLKAYAEYLEERIEELPEITKVEIRGVDDKEVRISIDLQKLESLNISFNDIAGAIQNENVSISGGSLLVDGYRRNIRVVGDFQNVQQIQDIVVKHEKGDLVYLRDIATVAFTQVETESHAREYGRPVVMLDVMKRSGENLLAVSEKIDNIIAGAKQSYLPENLDISITNNMSNRTRNQISELENSIIFGILLVVLVLMFFLGLRNALFVGIAIPMSMLMSFFILNAMGVTLNTIVLFSLVLALGMLVDNGIVVVENIYRLMSEGMSPIKAAKYGAGEVAMPIIASTATTLAAFVPLAMWPGIFGEFMSYLPLTLMIVLSSSLFVALVINPGLASALMKIEEVAPNNKLWTRISIISIIAGVVIGYLVDMLVPQNTRWLGNLLIIIGAFIVSYLFFVVPVTAKFQNTWLPKVEDVYKRTLVFALRGSNPYFFFGGTVALLVLSMMLLYSNPPKTLFFPSNQPNQALVYVEMPIGTDIIETNILTLQIEAEIEEVLRKFEYQKEVNGEMRPYNYMVESVIAQVGAGTSDPNQGPSMAQTPNKAKITIAFREFSERLDEKKNIVKSSTVLDEIRSAINDYPGALVVVDKDKQGPPAGAPINIEVKGEDYYELMRLAQEIRTFINETGITGIEELKLDVEEGKPEMPIIIDRVKARALGISTAQIGQALRSALFGLEVSRYKEGEDDYPINLRYSDQYRYNIDDLMNQKITFRDQSDGKIKQVPISSVAHATKTSTFSAVKRKDLNRVITIQSNVLEKYNPTETVNKIKDAMENFTLPAGYTIDFTGEQEKQAKELEFLSGALMIAVFLIFLILVGQFNSASTPFIILLTVFFSLIGVLLGLVIFRMDFVIMMTMIGIISLAGIVVNNAIVLIDYTEQLISRRKEDLAIDPKARLPLEDLYAAIVEAGKTRLRPVLLTAITTVLGLLPLATGMNINFFTLVSENNPQIYFGGDNVVFWGPMSWTVIFGLTFATFLTLIIVPVMFYILRRIRYSIAGKRV